MIENWIKKRKYLRLLKKLYSQQFIDDFDGNPDFVAWREEVSETLIQCFGENSRWVSNFAYIDFSYGGDPPRNQFWEGMIAAEAILNGSIYSIENFGLPKEDRSTSDMEDSIRKANLESLPYRKKGFWGTLSEKLIWPVLVIVVGYIAIDALKDDTAKPEPDVENLKNAQIAISDLHGFLKMYDSTLSSSLDSISFAFRKRNTFNSGAHFTATLKFCENHRMKRDVLIDSMFIRLRMLDVDTDTLKVRRKILTNLRSKLPHLGNNYRSDPNRYGLDTL